MAGQCILIMAKKEINQKHQAANFEAIKLITKGYQKMLYFLEGIPSTSFYSDFGDEADFKLGPRVGIPNPSRVDALFAKL